MQFEGKIIIISHTNNTAMQSVPSPGRLPDVCKKTKLKSLLKKGSKTDLKN